MTTPALTGTEARLALIIDLKQGRRFSVAGRSGVAWFYSRPLVEHPEDFDSEDEAHEHYFDMGRGICGCPESPDWFYGVMVGDDTEYPIDFDDVVLIDDDDYCSGCGQIGCGHG